MIKIRRIMNVRITLFFWYKIIVNFNFVLCCYWFCLLAKMSMHWDFRFNKSSNYREKQKGKFKLKRVYKFYFRSVWTKHNTNWLFSLDINVWLDLAKSVVQSAVMTLIISSYFLFVYSKLLEESTRSCGARFDIVWA